MLEFRQTRLIKYPSRPCHGCSGEGQSKTITSYHSMNIAEMLLNATLNLSKWNQANQNCKVLPLWVISTFLHKTIGLSVGERFGWYFQFAENLMYTRNNCRDRRKNELLGSYTESHEDDITQVIFLSIFLSVLQSVHLSISIYLQLSFLYRNAWGLHNSGNQCVPVYLPFPLFVCLSILK